jgi:hypothetical protein
MKVLDFERLSWMVVEGRCFEFVTMDVAQHVTSQVLKLLVN